MLINYLKLSLRLMVRNPFFTFINISGLGVGFAAFFALWNYSVSELKSDQYHKDFERIARVGGYWKWTDGPGTDSAYVTFSFTKSDIVVRAKEDFPEVEDYTRIHTQQFFDDIMGSLVPHGRRVALSTIGHATDEKIFKEEKIIYADQNLFNFFSIPLILGNAKDVLAEGGSVVLSESQAIKYFDKANPVGELLKLNDTLTLKVTGVFKDLPHYTHLNFNTVISNKPYLTQWATAYFAPTHSFVKLKPGSSFVDFENKINNRKKEYWSAVLINKPNTDIDLFVQPLKDIAFSPSFTGDDFTPRSKPLLTTFAIVSIIILAMAWINYINLWIARNEKREKELATRKINGAGGKDFVIQFLTESSLINLLAMLVAFTLLQFSRTPFKTFFNIQIDDVSGLDARAILIGVVVIMASIGITSLYPALVARSNRPLSLFKKSSASGSKNIFSSGLVIIQYTAAIALMLWSSIVYLELNHILNHDLGLDRDNVLVVEVPSKKDGQYIHDLEHLANQLSTHPSIRQVTYSRFVPGDPIGAAKIMRIPGNPTQIGFDYNGVNENFIPLFSLKLLAGRNFISDDRSDAIIISEVAAKRLGFESPAAAIGARLEVDEGFKQTQWLNVEVVGVFADYRTYPFYETAKSASGFKNEYESRGALLSYKNKTFTDFLPERIAIKVRPVDLNESIALAEKEFRALFPGEVFSWFFLDESINKVYANEKLLRNQILLFVGLAIVIACIGFLGMITHKVISKTKEIGIRKILGAGTSHISKVILQPSVIQFGISVLIGVPAAWYLGQLYLQKFSERVALQWWHYALPLLILVFILFCTVASLVWKAAKSNPVEALKYE